MNFQYSAQSNLNSFTNNSHVLSVTVPSGLSNSVMVIIKDCGTDLPWTTFTGITVNGSATGITAAGNSGSALAARSIRSWYLVAPTAGTYNVSVDFNTSSSNGGALTVLVFDGVDQTTPISDFEAGSTGSSSTPYGIASLTTPSGGYGVFAATVLSGTSVTNSAGTLVGAVGASAVSYLLNGTDTDFSWSGTSPTQVSSIAIALNPSSGGTPVSFTGTVPTINAVVGTSGSVDLASYFSGSLTPFTYSTHAGTLPTGFSRSGSVISWTTSTTVGTTTGIQIRATDTGSNVATTNSFNIVVTAVPSITINDWVNNTGTDLGGTTGVDIALLNDSTRALVLYSTGNTISGGHDITISNAAFTVSNYYVWVATKSSEPTWFASGRVQAS